MSAMAFIIKSNIVFNKLCAYFLATLNIIKYFWFVFFVMMQ